MHSPLPNRDGLTPSRLYLPKNEQWDCLLAFLWQRFPHMSADIIYERLKKGDMVDVNGVVLGLDSPYIADSWIWYYREVPKEVPVPFDMPVLYRDEFIVVVDKPHLLASIPGGQFLYETALVRIRKILGISDISPAHRLDRDTAGVLMFCLDTAKRGMYQQLFQDRQVEKVYEAVAPYKPELSFPLTHRSHIKKSEQYFTMCEDLGLAHNSQTTIELLAHNDSLAHYRLLPHTGKKHQLRVHLNSLGIAICNDGFYPHLLPSREPSDFSKPLQLLSRSLTFIDPITQQERTFTSQQQLAYTSLIYQTK